jgi:type IV secretion system protein VirB11
MNETTGAYLQTFLAPLNPWLDRADVTDLLVNAPGEVWFETRQGRMHRAEAPELTSKTLLRLAQQIAAASHQGVSREHPLLSATLPDGARVQIVAPPATREHLALAIRKHVVADLSLDTFDAAGTFSQTKRTDVSRVAVPDAELEALLRAGAIKAFLKRAVAIGKTILISGGTASGKTTFLNALLKETPSTQRIIAIEDAPEVALMHPNAVGLIAVKGALGEARVGLDDLMQAALRMRPDRLLVGEIRGAEAFTFLRAINTGHPGSMTTVHADSPRGALEQIAFMSMQAGVNLSRSDVIDYARETIDIIVQLARVNGQRLVTQIAHGLNQF